MKFRNPVCKRMLALCLAAMLAWSFGGTSYAVPQTDEIVLAADTMEEPVSQPEEPVSEPEEPVSEPEEPATYPSHRDMEFYGCDMLITYDFKDVPNWVWHLIFIVLLPWAGIQWVADGVGQALDFILSAIGNAWNEICFFFDNYVIEFFRQRKARHRIYPSLF